MNIICLLYITIGIIGIPLILRTLMNYLHLFLILTYQILSYPASFAKCSKISGNGRNYSSYHRKNTRK